MKLFPKIGFCFTFILWEVQNLLAYDAGGYELFCHDTHLIKTFSNHVLERAYDVVRYATQSRPDIPLSNYAVLSWTTPQDPSCPPERVFSCEELTVQQQAVLAVKRFLIGITNGKAILQSFLHPDQIVQAATNSAAGVTPYVVDALDYGGYASETARFLYKLLTGRGFPRGLGGAVGAEPNTIAIIFSADIRSSWNMKEIHWNSSSSLHINPILYRAMTRAFPVLGRPAPAAGVPYPDSLVYNSIRSLLTFYFPGRLRQKLHSAIIVTFRRTTDD